MFTALKTARDRMEGQTQLKAEVDALRIMCLEGGAHLAAKAADAYGASPATLAVLTKAAAPAANTQTSPEITGPSKTPGFEMSMRSASVFDAIAAEALTGPFHTRVAMLAGAMTAGEVAEGGPKVSGLVSFASNGLDPVKCVGAIAVTKLLLEGAPGALEAFQRELQGAVAAAADTAFLADIQATNSDTAQGASSGSLAAIVEDVTELLHMVHVGARSRLFLVVHVAQARAMAAAAFQSGYGGMTPQGGTFMGLRVLITESLPSSTMSLIDAAGMMMASTPLTFRVSEEAAIELATTSSMQSGPNVSAANVVSMFQDNSVAMISERAVGFAPLRPNSFATLTSIAWPITAESPM